MAYFMKRCNSLKFISMMIALCLGMVYIALYLILDYILIGTSKDVYKIRTPSANTKVKKILIWHYAFEDKSIGFGFGEEPFLKSCPKLRCLLTQNRNLVEFKDFDAVLFHFRVLNLRKLPSARFANQRWIFYETEPAADIKNNLHWYNGFFNWTMTYRKDSDIQIKYGELTSRNPQGENRFNKNYSKTKDRLVAWVVSRCRSPSWREKIVEDLQKFTQVDIYGSCGQSCRQGEDCFKMIERRYKFYLAFENSLCLDYVTEKLFRALQMDIVPIVYGGANYSSLAPHHSYINVEDFSSVKDLAEYLKYLDQNDTAYNEYFNWKLKYRSVGPREMTKKAFCDLCSKLHHDHQVKKYEDIYSWFVQDQCKRKRPKEYWEPLVEFVLQNLHLPIV